jgi:hypothetical protein
VTVCSPECLVSRFAAIKREPEASYGGTGTADDRLPPLRPKLPSSEALTACGSGLRAASTERHLLDSEDYGLIGDPQVAALGAILDLCRKR